MHPGAPSRSHLPPSKIRLPSNDRKTEREREGEGEKKQERKREKERRGRGRGERERERERESALIKHHFAQSAPFFSRLQIRVRTDATRKVPRLDRYRDLAARSRCHDINRDPESSQRRAPLAPEPAAAPPTPPPTPHTPPARRRHRRADQGRGTPHAREGVRVRVGGGAIASAQASRRVTGGGATASAPSAPHPPKALRNVFGRAESCRRGAGRKIGRAARRTGLVPAAG